MKIFLQFFLYLFHLIVSVIITLKSFKSCVNFDKKSRSEIRQEIEELIVKIEKLPQHVIVILGFDEVSLENLVRLISWCFLAKIQFITLYDPTGKFLFLQKIFEFQKFFCKIDYDERHFYF